MTGNEIRDKYLQFFKDREHLILPSASLLPDNDPTLLLIGAGMAPFKAFFTGKVKPPHVRITTCQKCVRTGDIDNVGQTARHHTFFEMLGNFSFGDYFKKEAIKWGWEFVTQELKIPAEKLWITIYTEDDEAFKIWHEEIGLPPERIVRLEENFWEIGEGPCGPCSEIYVDLGADRGCDSDSCAVGCDCDRYLEIWNLVFTQFNKEADGSYSELANKNIDTGAGLERLASVMQNKPSNFETDLIFPIIEYVMQMSGRNYGENTRQDISMKVIADHARSMTVMINDGVLPSNEGRGYVLRRILRRAVRHGRLLGIAKMFLAGAVDTVIKIFAKPYPELAEKRDFIQRVIQIEEERFNTTLEQGTELLNLEISKLVAAQKNILAGDVAFKLYDTFGFPWELTQEILVEHNLSMDKENFDKSMEEQRVRARAARIDKTAHQIEPDLKSLVTENLIYDENIDATEIFAIFAEDGTILTEAIDGMEVALLLAATPFYAESGGQVGDIGEIISATGKFVVNSTRKLADGTILHSGIITEGVIKNNESTKIKLDRARKMSIARNHTATHLLHEALRRVLGDHVNQAGSYVGADRLRFDFSHFSPVTDQELKDIENIVNEEILRATDLEIISTDANSAKQMGATALFGEKYGDIVRVVTIGDYSRELCGGTHVHNVSHIGLFKIVSESSTGAGIRRIEAVTGSNALKYISANESILDTMAHTLKCRPTDLLKRVTALQDEMKSLQNDLNTLNMTLANSQVQDVDKDVRVIKEVSALAINVTVKDIEALKLLGDKLRDKVNGVVVLISVQNETKVDILAMATKDANAKGINAGLIVKDVAKVLGGGGGGRPDMAQAGGKDASKINEAIATAWKVIETQIK